jgi:ATP-dependent Clp protease ATP-binding subunit ClpC
MYERFTGRAIKVMELAEVEARRFNHEYVGTEHVLLGLVRESKGVAANVLNNLNLDREKIRSEVEKIIESGPERVSKRTTVHTPRTKKAIEFAIEEARALDDHFVGTEALLLGLLRETEGIAARVLLNLDLKVDDVRQEVMILLGRGIDGGGEGEHRQRSGAGGL